MERSPRSINRSSSECGPSTGRVAAVQPANNSTVREGRGRGAYAAVVAARLHEAARAGCGLVGMYAREGTSAPIVERQGFEKHGPMVTWIRGRRE